MLPFLLVLSIISNIAFGTDCPSGWVDAGDICYKLENTLSFSWIKAQQHCQSLGGHLAEPLTEDSSNLLTSIASIETEVLGVTTWWLGLSDLGHEGRWIWQHSLTEAAYTNWASNYPSGGDVEKNCVRMERDVELRWMDDSCISVKASPICQLETNENTSTTPAQEVLVTLVGGNSSSGNVFALNSNGYFGPVCDDGWNYEEGFVVCNQLGFNGGTATRGSTFGDVPTDFAMDNVACQGSEETIQECDYNMIDDCNIGEGAGVYCY